MSAFQDWAEGDEAPWGTVNENNDALGQPWTFAQRKAGHSGLNVGIGGGPYTEAITISDQTVACTDDDDTYIVANRSTGALSAAITTTNWNDTATYGRVAIVTFASGVLTSFRDFRFGAGGIFRSSGGADAADVSITDAGGYYTGADVEAALQEVGAALAAITGGTELKGLTFTADTGSTADSDPGAGLFKWNNATQASATVLYIDEATADAVNIDTAMASLSAGTLQIQQGNDAARWQRWAYSATPVDGTGYWKLTVTLQAKGTDIQDGEVCFFDFDDEGVGGGGSLTHFTEEVNTSAPNSAVPVVSLTATNAASAVDASLVAKGTGATLAQVPDATAAGGNKRGTYATDWQKVRALASQVASGVRSFLGAGQNNSAGGDGAANVAGQSNQAGGARSFIGAGEGNEAAGDDSSIPGGSSNSTTPGGAYGVIGGGRSNIVAGSDGAIPGGRSNQVSGQYGVASGFSAIASAIGAQAHGRNITADGADTHARGRRFSAQGMVGIDGWASGTPGDSAFILTQSYRMTLRASTTDATATQATSDGAAVSEFNRPALSNSLGASVITVHGIVTASGTGNNVTDGKGWEIACVLRRGTSGNCALVGSVTKTVIGEGSGATTWDITLTADTTYQTLSLAVTGESGKTIRWAADLRVVHCTG